VWASADKVLCAAEWVETKYSSKAVTGNEHSIHFTLSYRIPATDVLSCSDRKLIVTCERVPMERRNKRTVTIKLLGNLAAESNPGHLAGNSTRTDGSCCTQRAVKM
jgi:hypothetical protein